jgi:uncharacterized protein YgfB (UPF0149 family)
MISSTSNELSWLTLLAEFKSKGAAVRSLLSPVQFLLEFMTRKLHA